MADIHLLSMGQVVFSKCGRDKGLPFIILKLDGEYAFLVDGRVRKLDNPKKKKLRHLQPVKHIDESVLKKLNDGRHIEDVDFRKALEPFTKEKPLKKPSEEAKIKIISEEVIALAKGRCSGDGR
jgi:ribosomal protein L14E/L6E/L27E